MTVVEQLRQLGDAVWGVTGVRRSGAVLTHYTKAGLTVERVAQIRRLAAHAVETGSPVARMDRPAEQMTAGYVLLAVIAGVEHGADMEASLRWARVLVAEPDPERVEQMRFGIGALDKDWLAVGPDRWLAYAAGLSVKEAQARLAVGTLDPGELRTLAALRGNRLAS